MNPAILVAARIAGVSKIYKIGGVQAIGAMAYGTESVPKVFKIFGPGNQYVMAAKQHVSLDEVAIDMPAGPSEVCVLADEQANAEFVAADLLSQAEHGIDSQVLFITTSEQKLNEVQAEVDRQLQLLPRKEMAAKALENSCYVLVDSVDEMIDLSNLYAPEHLILQVKDYEQLAVCSSVPMLARVPATMPAAPTIRYLLTAMRRHTMVSTLTPTAVRLPSST